MRLKRSWKIIFTITILCCFIGIIIVLLSLFAPKPPTGEVEYARELIYEAGRNNAASYSGRSFNEARSLYDSAMTKWKEENKRFILFRKYDEVSSYARSSAGKAEQAMQESKITSSNLQFKLKHKIDSLDLVVADLDRLFLAWPLPSEIRNRISRGKLLLKESLIAFDKGQYLQANRKIIDSEYLLTSSLEHASSNMTDYFRDYRLWKKWADETISASKRNSDYSVIVDKISRKCHIYHNGIKSYEFNIELGDNWVGHKSVRGDRATPEGMYKIIKKIGAGHSKYYKALLLDYPNPSDRETFRKKVAEGILPPSAKIGGQIEIHGSGGRGIDWTEGCVALTDPDMDIIYRIARVGTPVTIVGSLADLDDILR